MSITTETPIVNPAPTSDGAPRSNLMTREEFLHRVLHSGQITRIAQHLAVVIFLVAAGRNQLRISVRDLERITGWSRPAIKDHLAELEVFMRVTFGGGRAKALFELQGVIEDALAHAVMAGSTKSQGATSVMANQPATAGMERVANHVAESDIVASNVATKVVASKAATRDFVVNQPAANSFVAGHLATSLLASVAATGPVMAGQSAITPTVVASQVATRSSIERDESLLFF